MLDRFLSIFRRRSYDGAAGGRRWRGQPDMAAPIASAHAGRFALASRAKYAVANNPLAAAAVQAWTAQAVGSGIKAGSLHVDAAIRETLNARFAAWVDVADDEGRTDWFGIQHALFKSMVTTGEGLALLLNTAAGLRVRVLDPEQLDASYSANLDGGGRIVAGVEFDADGRRVGYHLFDQPLGLETALNRQRRRVPAEDVIHVFKQDWPGQVRGVSWFSPALLRLADLDGWRDAQLVRQKTAAMLTGFVKSIDGSGQPFAGEQNGPTLVGGLSPGTIQYLDPNQEITFSTPANIGAEVISFAEICEREIAAALGLPAHAFGDVTKANYSSLKSANTAWRARVEAIQWSCFIHLVCLPVWRRWATIEVLSGKVQTTVDAAMPVKHVTPKWPSLEPMKDAGAEILELKAGLTTRRALLAARGEDIEQIDKELHDDADRAERLGLSFPALAAANDNEKPAAAQAA